MHQSQHRGAPETSLYNAAAGLLNPKQNNNVDDTAINHAALLSLLAMRHTPKM
jgi:hypothetical protein